MLLDALYRAVKMSDQIASAAIVTDAKDQKAQGIFIRSMGLLNCRK